MCERLGQFTNLKSLKIGYSYRYIGWGMDWTHEIGLNMLAKLTKLEELDLYSLDKLIVRVEEVKWMVDHWLKLSKLQGLDPDSKAYEWLKENYPRIRLN